MCGQLDELVGGGEEGRVGSPISDCDDGDQNEEDVDGGSEISLSILAKIRGLMDCAGWDVEGAEDEDIWDIVMTWYREVHGEQADADDDHDMILNEALVSLLSLATSSSQIPTPDDERPPSSAASVASNALSSTENSIGNQDPEGAPFREQNPLSPSIPSTPRLNALPLPNLPSPRPSLFLPDLPAVIIVERSVREGQPTGVSTDDVDGGCMVQELVGESITTQTGVINKNKKRHGLYCRMKRFL